MPAMLPTTSQLGSVYWRRLALPGSEKRRLEQRKSVAGMLSWTGRKPGIGSKVCKQSQRKLLRIFADAERIFKEAARQIFLMREKQAERIGTM